MWRQKLAVKRARSEQFRIAISVICLAASYVCNIVSMTCFRSVNVGAMYRRKCMKYDEGWLVDDEDRVTKLHRNVFTIYQLTQNNIPEDLDLRVRISWIILSFQKR